jgi:plastocyanin
MPQIVYILTNSAMPGLIKIGRTDRDLQSRVKELNTQTGVPLAFEVHYACEVADSVAIEKALHDGFADDRINPKREFFRKNPERVVAILRHFAIKQEIIDENATVEFKEEIQALNKEQTKKRESFRFDLVDIQVGTQISFVRDENIKATVIDDKKISLNGEITSLSAGAQNLLSSEYPVSGTIYWTFEGETLDERRIRLSGN